MEPFAQYAVAAAKEAFEDAKIDMSQENPYRAGVIVGSGIGSLQAVETNYEKILQKGPSRVNPLMVPLMISNMAAGKVFIQLGFIQRKMYQCCDSMRIRNPLYRRRISCDCIWRSGSLRGRRCRKLYLPKRRGRIYGADRAFGF